MADGRYLRRIQRNGNMAQGVEIIDQCFPRQRTDDVVPQSVAERPGLIRTSSSRPAIAPRWRRVGHDMSGKAVRPESGVNVAEFGRT